MWQERNKICQRQKCALAFEMNTQIPHSYMHRGTLQCTLGKMNASTQFTLDNIKVTFAHFNQMSPADALLCSLQLVNCFSCMASGGEVCLWPRRQLDFKMSLQLCWILMDLCFIVPTVSHMELPVVTKLISLTWIRSRWNLTQYIYHLVELLKKPNQFHVILNYLPFCDW